MSSEWRRFQPWRDVPRDQFEDAAWQDRNAVIHIPQLRAALSGLAAGSLLDDIESGLARSRMSIRLTPYVMSLIDWEHANADPIRRQFLPLASEAEPDHPCSTVDPLTEICQSPTPGLVHRYPDKALMLTTSACPVYCQFCTRSYATGRDAACAPKERVCCAKDWPGAIAYIRGCDEIVDVVLSGGDLSRVKAANVTRLGEALLDIPHVRRIRLATRALSVQPMRFLTDDQWTGAVLELIARARAMFKDACIHTHFNHPNEVTPLVEQAMRRLHAQGALVRSQTVLLRGVNDDAEVLTRLFKRLGDVNIHPYYVYLCDMVKGVEHFRLPLATAQRLEKEVRGATAGFNTPAFIVDTSAGKRDVHSAESYDCLYGVSTFVAPAVAPGRRLHCFDPLRSLGVAGRRAWRTRAVADIIREVERSASELSGPRRTAVPEPAAAE